MRRSISTPRLVVFSALVLFLVHAVTGCGSGGTSGGAGTLSATEVFGNPGGVEIIGNLPTRQAIRVVDVDDTATPQSIKDKVYYESGKIIAQHVSGNPNEPNPKYPCGKIVVIRVETSDFPRNTAADDSYINGIFFGSGNILSIQRYFIVNSYGKFIVSSGGVPDWVRLRQTLAFYGSLEEPPFLKAVLRQADVDWKALDTNGDGKITQNETAIVYLIPNADSALTFGIAQCRYPDEFEVETPDGTFTFNTPVVQFSLVQQSDPNPSANPIRLLSSVAHELLHDFFSITDRYGNGQIATGVGPYDIMATDRSWKMMTMYDRMKIGWIQPRVIAHHDAHLIEFFGSSNSKHALVLLKPASDPEQIETDEMWVVENRDKAMVAMNIDQGLPESGLAIWWARKGTWAGGEDEVRLVDSSKPDQSPTLYTNPQNNAFFRRGTTSTRLLFQAVGGWSLLYFKDVSDPGPIMTAEF